VSANALPDRRLPETDIGPVLAASVAGDRRAFEELVDRHKNLVWSIIRVCGVHGADAEDVFQLTFVRLFEHQASIRDPSRLPGWLATTTRRECYDTVRRRQRSSSYSLVDDVLDTEHLVDFDARLVQDERLRVVAQAYAELSDQCRDLLRLLAVDPPLGYDEISEILGTPRGSIGPTRQRCLDKLRRHPAMRRIREEPR
jgi:RNA polymerase sigma factor (sigma-70 family)